MINLSARNKHERFAEKAAACVADVATLASIDTATAPFSTASTNVF